MRSKKSFSFLSLIVFFTAFFAIIYIGLAKYYENGFSINTWINGVYCTGKSVEEINDELKGEYETRSIEVIYPDGNVEYIFPDEFDFRIDFSSYLNSIKESQDPYLWILNSKSRVKKLEISPLYYYDEEELISQINNLTFVKEHTRGLSPYVFFAMGENGYELIDNHVDQVDFEKLYDSVLKALYTEDPVILGDEYLKEYEYSDEEKEFFVEKDIIDKYLETKIVYDMGDEEIPVDSLALSGFIELGDDGLFVKDESGNLKIFDDKVKAFVNDLCDRYNTADKSRLYTTVNGEVKTIKNVYYGTIIDRRAECDYLIKAVKENIRETHTPEYIKKGFALGEDDIGNTYIEIDLTNQVLYFFEDGMVSLCCDIVSGKPGVNGTPQMICYVYKKQKAAILRGDNYASYVDYWMPIYKGIGLHDASWQREFGGERYLTHGSHGCINLKKADAKYIYDHIEVGIPVILYY